MLVTVGILLTVFNSFTGLFQFIVTLVHQLVGVFADYCLSKASIKSKDESYDYVMEYLIQNEVCCLFTNFMLQY